MAPPAQLADAIAELLQSSVLSQPLAPITPTPTIDAKTIGQLIDHTLLAPGSTPKEIEDASKIAVQYNAKTLCVNSSMIPTAVKALGSGGPKAISVVGFPFGAANTPGKVEETKFAVQQGAEEIDMVQNIGFLRAQQYDAVLADVKDVVEAASPKPVKVIIETSLLSSPQEIAISSLIACLGGAKFVKTSTGYGGGGAKPEDVRLMYEVARKYNVEVKASGGIRSLETVKTMIANGATRVGASGTAQIIAEAQGNAPAAGGSGSAY